jgi:hypothetical protein
MYYIIKYQYSSYETHLLHQLDVLVVLQQVTVLTYPLVQGSGQGPLREGGGTGMKSLVHIPRPYPQRDAERLTFSSSSTRISQGAVRR